MSSFSNKKELRFVITLGTGTFGSSNNNQITLEGYRAVVEIDKAGWKQLGTLRASIYGVKQADMNSATTLQWNPQGAIKNQIEVYAIDGAQETLVYLGDIVNAWGNYDQMPDVFLQIQARNVYFAQLTPVSPRSYNGQIDVASVMSQIAQSMTTANGTPFTFENNGVTVQLANQYLAGTAMDQALRLAEAAGIDLYIDNSILAITPPNTARGTKIVEISSKTGLKGYPTFDGVGVNFEVFFNPAILYGGTIKLNTSLPQAAGQWIVTSVAHRLESEKPGGAWFSRVRGNKSGLAVTS